LQDLANALGVPLADIRRKAEEEYVAAAAALPLQDSGKLAAWVHDHPRVLERPIVVNEDTGRAAIGRPPENILDIIKK
jgi:arsenate reductase